MKLLNIFIIIFSFSISFNTLRAQSDIIAKIGNNELTKDEFRLRYELSPRILSSNLTNTDSLKLKFLYSLLAEKLWAVESLDQGLANSDDFKFFYTPIEKMYVRDELFRIEIKEKVKVTDNDISKGMRKYIKILKIKTLSSIDSSKINNIYSQLMEVGTLDSLIKINTSLSQEFSELEIKFGDLIDEVLEDKLYKLNINEHTVPIQNENNWFIFELKGTKPNIPEVSQDKFQREVEKIIRNRKTRNIYKDFYKKNFGDYTLEADEEIFLKLSEELYKVIISRIYSDENKTQKYYLTESDILKVKDVLGFDFLNQELFNSKFGPAKVYEFLSDLTIVDVSFDEVNQSLINKVLSNELKRFIQQETVYRIGREMGIQYSGELKSELDLWKDNLLAQILKNSYNSQIKVTEGEIRQYYNEIFSDSSIISRLNLQSISTSDLEQVEAIFNLIENGDSFEQIISKFDSSQSVSIENISDFSRLKDFGQAMDAITELDVGEIYGPIKTASGYTIIKVIEPGIMRDSVKMEIQKVKDQIYQKLFYEKLNKLLEDKTIDLANKYGIIISEDFIFSEQYSDVNFFVHKYIGFGGRIAAVPFVTPSYKWYYRWKTQTGIIP